MADVDKERQSTKQQQEEDGAMESSGDYVEASSATATASRKSMTLCGVCDSRIATIFVNGVNLSMLLVSIMFAAIRSGLFWKALGGGLVLALPGLILSGLGLYGALQFELWAMYLATAGFLVAVIIDGILMNWLGLVVTLIVLIPHCILTHEMRWGIMTKDTYEVEEYLIPEGREIVEKAHSYMAPTTSVSAAVSV